MKNTKLIAASSLTMLIVGLTSAIIGPLLVPMSESFKLNLSQTGSLVSFRFLGFFLSSVFIGLFWQRSRAGLFLVGSSFLLSLALLTIGFWPVLPVVCVLLFAVGLSSGLVHTGVDSLLSEIYPEVRIKVLNLVHIFFGVGAFLGPIMVGTVLWFFGWWNLVYYLVGMGALVLFFLFLTQNLKETQSTFVQTQTGAQTNLTDLTKSVPFWLLAIGMFFYVGSEVSLSSWVPMFMVKVRDTSAVVAGYTNSVFWIALLVGRLLFIYLSDKISTSRLLALAALCATVFAIGVFSITSHILIIAFLACTGFFASGIYPTVLALGGHTFPNRIGMIIAILTAAGSLGGICFPWLVGFGSEYLGLGRGIFIIPVLMGFAAAAFVYLEGKLIKKEAINIV